MASILQANNIAQVQWEVRPTPIHYELRSSSSFHRGNETVLAKSFIIAVEGDALAWYSMLKTSTVYSWENLRDKILPNFKGFTSESLTSIDLF
jgi:hypothetical protein